MANIGIGGTIILILFGTAFILWLGGYSPGFVTLTETLSQNPEDLANLVLGNLGGLVLASGVVVTYSYLTRDSASVSYLISVGILVAVTGIIFMPLTLFNDLALPYEIRLLVMGYFNILFVLAIISFMTGRDF